ncbi:MAG: LysE family translocator [Proteobacteria bacterium]|nr:LysE family translocator [Pseudomonadota bacterium]
MSLELYLAYVAACILVAVIPGPMVALVVANGLSHGTRAALLNVAGSQLGLAVMLGTLVVGLASIVAALGWWFDWLRLIGAAYLIWLGIKLLRATGAFEGARATQRPRGGFFLQGLLVMLSNPKVLLFFGAFIPQFIDPAGDADRQVLLLGATAMVIATLSDGSYALLTGRAGRWLSRRRVRLASRLSGACLIGGGVWLALTRPRLTCGLRRW